jgi:Kef-type K+ transport system membrane component KefB
VDLIIALLFLFVAARLAGEAMERLGQSPMIGEVLAGVLLGPSVLGLIDPDVTRDPGASLAIVAQLGVLVLVLLAGIELGKEGLRQAFKERSMVVAYLEFILPFTLGYALATLIGLSFGQALFLGTALAVTALPVSVRILLDLNLLHSRVGRAIVSVALVNDLVAFAMLGLVLEIARLGSAPPSADVFLLIVAKNVAFFGVVLSGSLALKHGTRIRPDGRSHVEALLRRLRGQEATFAFCVMVALALGAVAESVGIHFAIGAFYGGILLGPKLLGGEPFHHMRRSMSAVTFGLLAPIFFGFVGLNFRFTSASWALVAVITGTAFAGKLLGGLIGGYVAGFRGSPLLALGVGLNARGMMELLLAGVGLATGIINQEIYTSLIVMTLATTLATPPLLKRLLKRFKLEDVMPRVPAAAGGVGPIAPTGPPERAN